LTGGSPNNFTLLAKVSNNMRTVDIKEQNRFPETS